MSEIYDLVVRGGLVVDGRGGEPFEADVGISNGLIAAVGRGLGPGAEEIDAKGLLVTPGFVDLHTHYDGQVTWESRLTPSSAHGVTTAIMGNCGVGFAPCRPDQRDTLIRLMEGVEDIPNPVLVEGLPWTWESYPEYLDILSQRNYDMDVGSFLPHAPLRVFVMGQRALDLEPATSSDLEQMGAITREAMAAGAMGFGTSRTLFHRSSDGSSIPTLRATEEELTTLAMALKDSGSGVIQIVAEDFGSDSGFAMARRLCELSGRPLTFAMASANWQTLLARVREANADGLGIYPQIMTRAVGFILGHEMTLNPFHTTTTYRALAHLPFEAKIAELRRPEVREAILKDVASPDEKNALGNLVRNFAKMFILGDPPQYEQPPEASIAARAAKLGVTPESLAYDLMLEKDGRNTLYMGAVNYEDGNLDAVRAILDHPDTVPGLGDGGAHCGTICDGSYSTFMLSHFVRDRDHKPLMSLAFAIEKLTRAPAEIVGLLDRGVIAPGYKADINVIDFERLSLHAPVVAYDMPSGGRRLIQGAEGYRATIVSGKPVYRDGEATGALPGRLVRGAQVAPAA